MILCSCNLLTSADLKAAAQSLRESDPSQPVTPIRLFQSLGVKPQCGNCLDALCQTLAGWGFIGTCPEPLAGQAEGEKVD